MDGWVFGVSSLGVGFEGPCTFLESFDELFAILEFFEDCCIILGSFDDAFEDNLGSVFPEVLGKCSLMKVVVENVLLLLAQKENFVVS